MITILCTTDRPGSNSGKASRLYQSKLASIGEQVQELNMKNVDIDWIAKSNYGTNCPEFEAIVCKYIRSVDRIILIVPEYNGSFPGIFKFFMDACDHQTFKDKKIALMGLAAGRSGNVRGLDHLTGVFHYLGAEVYSNKVYLSLANQSVSASGELDNDLLQTEIAAQIKGFLTF